MNSATCPLLTSFRPDSTTPAAVASGWRDCLPPWSIPGVSVAAPRLCRPDQWAATRPRPDSVMGAPARIGSGRLKVEGLKVGAQLSYPSTIGRTGEIPHFDRSMGKMSLRVTITVDGAYGVDRSGRRWTLPEDRGRATRRPPESVQPSIGSARHLVQPSIGRGALPPIASRAPGRSRASPGPGRRPGPGPDACQADGSRGLPPSPGQRPPIRSRSWWSRGSARQSARAARPGPAGRVDGSGSPADRVEGSTR
jgi:hypothetical protein